jgi:hypothetical protein
MAYLFNVKNTDPFQVCLDGQTSKNLNQQNNKMKKRIASTLLLAVMAFMTMDAIAQETEEHVRMEYILCSLNEGFTFQDVINNAKEYGEKVTADGSKYNQFLLRPMMTGERLEGITHIIAGMWPDGKELYKEYGNYVNKYIDEDLENSPHTCRITYATMDRIVINDFRENETTDQRWPLQLSDCNLKEGVSMDYAIQVQKDVHQASVANNMRGYGVHFQVPYLGFQDSEIDFLSAVWWQSFEHRGNMAQNYYKIAETHGQQMDAVASCKNDRAYFAERIFTTWE